MRSLCQRDGPIDLDPVAMDVAIHQTCRNILMQLCSLLLHFSLYINLGINLRNNYLYGKPGIPVEVIWYE